MNIGCRAADATDAVQGARVPIRLLYATHATPTTERFGPYSLDVALDAPVEGTHLPLVVVSHGNGGTPWAYRGLAAHLARAGFVVALVEHPGNSRNDDALAGTVANLQNRPRHVRLAIDAAFTDDVVGGHISRGPVTVIGHSIGGYTALAVAGGHPSCFPHESPDGQSHPIEVDHDVRVRALVLLAPAAVWYIGDGALSDVDLPILLWTGDKDPITPPLHAEIIRGGVRDATRIDHRVAVDGGHFAFQTPFPAAMTRPDFPPSQDPPGFDRAAFQDVMSAAIVDFLRRAL